MPPASPDEEPNSPISPPSPDSPSLKQPSKSKSRRAKARESTRVGLGSDLGLEELREVTPEGKKKKKRRESKFLDIDLGSGPRQRTSRASIMPGKRQSVRGGGASRIEMLRAQDAVRPTRTRSAEPTCGYRKRPVTVRTNSLPGRLQDPEAEVAKPKRSRAVMQRLQEQVKAVGIPPQELEEWSELFDLFDQTGDGKIDGTELTTLMATLGMAIDADGWALLQDFDQDSDGELDFEEFATMIMKLREVAPKKAAGDGSAVPIAFSRNALKELTATEKMRLSSMAAKEGYFGVKTRRTADAGFKSAVVALRDALDRLDDPFFDDLKAQESSKRDPRSQEKQVIQKMAFTLVDITDLILQHRETVDSLTDDIAQYKVQLKDTAVRSIAEVNTEKEARDKLKVELERAQARKRSAQLEANDAKAKYDGVVRKWRGLEQKEQELCDAEEKVYLKLKERLREDDHHAEQFLQRSKEQDAELEGLQHAKPQYVEDLHAYEAQKATQAVLLHEISRVETYFAEHRTQKEAPCAQLLKHADGLADVVDRLLARDPKHRRRSYTEGLDAPEPEPEAPTDLPAGPGFQPPRRESPVEAPADPLESLARALGDGPATSPDVPDDELVVRAVDQAIGELLAPDEWADIPGDASDDEPAPSAEPVEAPPGPDSRGASPDPEDRGTLLYQASRKLLDEYYVVCVYRAEGQYTLAAFELDGPTVHSLALSHEEFAALCEGDASLSAAPEQDRFRALAFRARLADGPGGRALVLAPAPDLGGRDARAEAGAGAASPGTEAARLVSRDAVLAALANSSRRVVRKPRVEQVVAATAITAALRGSCRLKTEKKA